MERAPIDGFDLGSSGFARRLALERPFVGNPGTKRVGGYLESFAFQRAGW
jgi:hypothetical protein